MTLQRHWIATMRAGARRGNADAADLVASRLEKLETATQRLQVVSTLARSRDAGGLQQFGYRRPAVSRLLNSSGERALLAEPAVRILNTQRQIATLRELAQQLAVGEGASEQTGAAVVDETGARVLYRFASKPDKSLRALARRAGFFSAEVRNTHVRALDAQALTALRWLRDEIAKRQR